MRVPVSVTTMPGARQVQSMLAAPVEHVSHSIQLSNTH